MAEPVISLQNVTYAYNGGGDVLQNVNLAVDRGAFLAIIGPNGGGKTTLVKLILGLFRPKTGAVRVLGADPAETTPNLGYVPQYAAIEPSFPITVLDVVLLGLGRASSQRFSLSNTYKDKARKALAQVEMEAHAARRFDSLSGGQRQRVLIARALVSAPDLLLFDEPTSNIDPHGKLCLYDILSELSKTITVVLVSHDLVSARTGITDVAVVNERLIQGKEITQEMLTLIYGMHGPSCPMDSTLKTLSSMFTDVGAHHD